MPPSRPVPVRKGRRPLCCERGPAAGRGAGRGPAGRRRSPAATPPFVPGGPALPLCARAAAAEGTWLGPAALRMRGAAGRTMQLRVSLAARFKETRSRRRRAGAERALPPPHVCSAPPAWPPLSAAGTSGSSAGCSAPYVKSRCSIPR